MIDKTPNSYDEVPYASHPIRETHPDRLATIATLMGATPQPPDNCRVLELGCASAGNLIPIATAYPNSEFVGVDLSSVQIAAGQSIVDELALKNVDLRAASILDIDESFGEFDYILCHGVFSWVPEDVRNKILAISSDNLSANGVAYVSYNTYPGWHMREMIRNMMRYHTELFPEPGVQIRQARALLRFLSEAVPSDSGAYGQRLREELEWLRTKADHYLFHEHLEEVNVPVYFHQFMQRAEEHGLQYLGESIFAAMTAAGLPPEAEQTLRRITSDTVRTEQYMDFLRNRTFRQTLLCHQNIELTRQVTPAKLASLYVGSSATPAEHDLQVGTQQSAKFVFEGGANLSTRSPIVKSAMLCLSKIWPNSISMQELWSRACERIQAEQGGDAVLAKQTIEDLSTRLFKCYVSSVVHFSVHPTRFATEISECPKAFELARYQADRASLVTNMKHQAMDLKGFHRQVLRCLDGTRDRSEMLDALVEMNFSGEEKMSGDPEQARQAIDRKLDESLRYLASYALLVN